MSVKKTKSGKYVVVHCHGKKKGKPIKSSKPTTKKKAQEQHAAIAISKKKRKKTSKGK